MLVGWVCCWVCWCRYCDWWVICVVGWVGWDCDVFVVVGVCVWIVDCDDLLVLLCVDGCV